MRAVESNRGSKRPPCHMKQLDALDDVGIVGLRPR